MPPPLWALTQCLTVIMAKTSSLAGFPELHCPLPHVLWLCTSRKSLVPSSLYPLMTKLQTGVRLCHSSSQYWISLVFLACLSLAILDVSVRNAGDLEVSWPFSCFLAFWGKRKHSLEKYQFVKDCWDFPCLFCITNLNSSPLQTLVTLSCFICK